MIAIVGAKGGCGKTTTTLGLAAALARAGDRAVAVDADRRLPTLHVAAGVDREPTVLDVADPGDVPAVAHPTSESSGAGVLPAPPASADVDFREAVSPLADVDAAVLLDCPSGTDQCVVEPLSAANAAVVVTTPTDQSVAAASRTVVLADRLDVPVAGTVVTRIDEAQPAVAARVGAPVIGAIPEASSPLAARSVRDAFDDAATRLEPKNFTLDATIDQNRMVGRLETGIDVLDRKLDGGLPPGSVVAYTADPASQSELLLYELTAARGTLYLSTRRSEEAVRHAIESSQAKVGSPTVRHLASDESLEEAERLVEALPDGANLIVDPMDVLERTDRDEFAAFMNALKAEMLETGSIAVLHCLKSNETPENRSTTEHVADAVFDLRTTVGATELENHLTIPKFRGGGAPSETIKLELSQQVEVDTSRDIA